MTARTRDHRLAPATRRLLRCAAAAGPAFATTFLVEGARRPHYDPARHPVSALSLGPGGWVQVANFVVAGSLYTAGGIGLARDRLSGGVLPGLLVSGAGVGLLASGAFPTDPVHGYPPGAPTPPRPTATGAAHLAASVPIFAGLPVAALACARTFRRRGEGGWAVVSAASGLVTPTAFALAAAGFGDADGLRRRGGLLQRASIVSAFGWVTAMAVRALRADRSGRSPA